MTETSVTILNLALLSAWRPWECDSGRLGCGTQTGNPKPDLTHGWASSPDAEMSPGK